MDNIKGNSWNFRFLEPATYGLFSAGLIGHVFTINGPVELANTVAVCLGIGLGVMAVCGLRPFTNRLAEVEQPENLWRVRIGDVLPSVAHRGDPASNRSPDQKTSSQAA